MIKCIIIDDEPEAINILREYINETPDLALSGSSTNALEMLDFLQNNEVDFIFLDINMPKISGLDFIKLAKQVSPKINIILTTAYTEYAIKGFELEVIDYLLKPISIDRFLQAVQRVKFFLDKVHSKEADIQKYFFVKLDTKNKSVKINFEDIIYIEGLKNYVSILTVPERIVAFLNMKDLEKLLPVNKFKRVHKSYIIPTDRIKSIDGNRIYLTGAHGVIPIGPSYRASFIDFLNKNSIK